MTGESCVPWEPNPKTILTGLSRGQICDTKLSQFFRHGVFDDAEIERELARFRKLYHARKDDANRLIGDDVLSRESQFNELLFIDFFRYSGVTKAGIARHLQEHCSYWTRPGDTGGCSSNCQINDAGIQVHLEKRGFHNYAPPLSWDVRLGHIAREDALAQLRIIPDPAKVHTILRRIGFHS